MKKLKSFLKRKKLQQNEFAGLVKTSPANLCRILQDQFLPDLALAQRIEKITDGEVRCIDW